METKSPSRCGEDIISKLPDELIHYILSFNDTKYAVQTCVLSKRWIHLWKSLPFLNICRRSFPQGREHDQRFIYFVDMLFILRGDSDIQRFVLLWFVDIESNDDVVTKYVNRWIVHAVMRKVQEITIEITQHCHAPFEIPHQLLNCRSLTNFGMKMIGGAEYIEVTLPKSMDLPRLKVLSLVGISISNVELSKRLFSSCPVIESVEMLDCDIRSLIVNSLSLKSFVYMQLRSTMANIIKLTAPNLTEFCCSSAVTQHYSLENCSLVSRVYVELIPQQRVLDENAYWKLPSEETQAYAKRMTKFLTAIQMVKKLTLSSGFLEVLSQAPDLLDFQPHRLCNLQYLRLDMWSTRGCLRAIAYLLKISPNITRLALISKESDLADVGDDWKDLAALSLPGTLSYLKYVQMVEVEGWDAEFKLLSFLLRYAKTLEQVNVFFRSSEDDFLLRDAARKVLFRSKLRAVPTASSSVKLVFFGFD